MSEIDPLLKAKTPEDVLSLEEFTRLLMEQRIGTSGYRPGVADQFMNALEGGPSVIGQAEIDTVNAYKPAFTAIARQVPEEYRTKEFVFFADLRPFYQQMTQPDAKVVRESYSGGGGLGGSMRTGMVMESPITDYERDKMQTLLDNATARLTGEITAQFQAGKINEAGLRDRLQAVGKIPQTVNMLAVEQRDLLPADEQPPTSPEAEERLQTTVTSANTESDTTGAQTPAAVDAGSGLELGALLDPQGGGPQGVLSKDMLEAMFQIDPSDEYALGQLQGMAAAEMAGEMNAASTLVRNPIPQATARTGRDAAFVSMPGMMSLNETMRALYSRSPNEVRSLQNQLAQAGYYDRVGGGPAERGYVDEATQKAWQLLIADSYRERRNMLDILHDRVGRRRRGFEQEANRVPTDMLEVTGNKWAGDAIGRNLRPDEQRLAQERYRSYARRYDISTGHAVYEDPDALWAQVQQDLEDHFAGEMAATGMAELMYSSRNWGVEVPGAD